MIYKVKFLRKMFIPLLSLFDFDITCKHHWTPNKLKLNFFKHKNYWYHEKKRELSTMLLFKEFITHGDTVIECGGHIGYISIYFSNLVGNTGKVTIFEPGSNNISYLKDNTEKIHNIKFIEAAVGESNGEVQFYEENLSGQNNSIVKDFDGLKENMNNAFIKVSKETRMVKLISLDSYFCEQKNISFIKIDIEGYEWQAICGAKKLISTQKPILMIEVLSSKQEIFDFFYSMNYVMFSPEMNIITESKELNKNIFFLHRISHTSLLDRLGIG